MSNSRASAIQLSPSATKAFELEQGISRVCILCSISFLGCVKGGSVHTRALEDTEDLVACTVAVSTSAFQHTSGVPKHTGHDLDLGNTVGVTENDTDLRGGRALLGELADLVDDLLGGGLEPRRRVARVGDGGGRDALALAVKTTHVDGGGVGGETAIGCCRVVRVGRWLAEEGCERNFPDRNKLGILWAEKFARVGL